MAKRFSTQKEAKIAYDEYMNNYSKTAIKTNSTMSYQEFYETYFEPDYKRSVGQSTFDNRKSSMRLHFAYFYKTKLKDINPTMLKKWQNKLSEKYSNAYIRNVYGAFQMSLDLAVKLGLVQSNIAKQVGNDTIRYLSEWRMVQSKNAPSKYVLSHNGIPTNKSTASHIIERHSKLAGVHRIKTHALRHSHASLLISLGENALIVRDRLGHEDIETTLGTYGHLYPNTNRGVADKLTSLLIENNSK